MTSEDETYEPFPRPGDADFTSFPKTTSEDTIYYSIFYLPSIQPSPQTARTALAEVQQTLKSIEKQHFKSYIWQRGSFSVSLQQFDPTTSLTSQTIQETSTVPVQEAGEDKRLPHWYLCGSCTFADSLADESAVLYMLREASLKHSDVWIHTTDNDGEFLLIEAAHTLPEWVEPDTGANRAWIHQGDVHLIPASLSSGTVSAPEQITEAQAILHLSSSSSTNIKDAAISEAALFRIRDHPDALALSAHSTFLLLPRMLAHLLHALPNLISPISEAWYARDAVSLAHLKRRTESTDTLVFSMDDLVTTVTRFTRVCYAQTLAAASPPHLQAWIDAAEPESLRKHRETSAKIIAGAEMMLADPGRSNDRPVREMQLLLADLEDGEDSLPTDDEIAKWPQKEDSEEWLDVDFSQLERELKGQIAKSDEKDLQTKGFGDKAAQENLRRIVEGFEKFLGDEKAGVDGAEFGGEASEDDDQGDESEDDSVENIDRDADIMQSLREMMGKSVPKLQGEPGADAFWASVKERGYDEGQLPPGARESDPLEEIQKLVGMSSQRRDGPLATEQLGLDLGEMEDTDEEDWDAEEDSDDEITLDDVQKVMQEMEDELRRAGVFSPRATTSGKGKGKQALKDIAKGDEDDSNDDDEIDEFNDDDARENLARNILQAFKEGQGSAGPVGGMMGAMGLGLPRDEDDVHRKGS